MRNLERLGAILVGAGLGILFYQLFPALSWLWPLGLVAAGVLIWQRLGSAAVRTALVSLSVLLGLLSVNLGGLSPFAASERSVAYYQATPNQTQSWREVERVVVRNSVGSIRATSSDGEVVASVRYFRRQPGGRVPNELQARYDEATRELTLIGLDPDDASRQRGLRAEIALELPRHVSLKVVNGVGDVSVHNLHRSEIQLEVGRIKVRELSGELIARNDVGNIEVENAVGSVSVQTRVGEIRLFFDRPVAAPVQAKSDVGNVSILLPSGSNATVRAVSQVRNLSGELEPVTASEGRLRLGAGETDITLETRVGEVSVRTR
jgi:hypothetical protein